MRLRELKALLAPRPVPLRPTARALAGAYNIAALQSAAYRALPRAVFDYVEGGAEDEVSLRGNRAAFAALELVPGICKGVSFVDTSVELLGERLPTPVVLAPTGFTRMVHHEGERAVARGASVSGTPYVLSTMATCSVEAVAAAAPGPKWFQLYLLKDRALCSDLIRRARECGYRQLVLTVDNAAQGARERDVRNGLTIPPALTARTFLDGVRRPRWSYHFLASDPIEFATIRLAEDDPATRMRKLAQGFEGTVTWDDVEWVQEQWGAPILLKGLLASSDVAQAGRLGLSGVVLSNHGGRQLDHAPAPIDMLAEARCAAADGLAILLDSGIRRGSDIVKAVALGADAVLVGRPYLYGLGAAGAAGVARAVEILRSELVRVLTLLGVAAVAELDESYVRQRRAALPVHLPSSGVRCSRTR